MIAEAHVDAAAQVRIERLTRRRDYLYVAKGRRAPRRGVVVQARANGETVDAARVGFTASRKVGGAVVRNRAKRRLKEAVRLLAPLHARSGVDYVFIARRETPTLDWAVLVDDVKSALIQLQSVAAAGAQAPERAQRGGAGRPQRVEN